MDSATLTALGVFDPTPHPSLMGIGSPHEGFSLSRLLDRTATPMGRDLFRRRLARPVYLPDLHGSANHTERVTERQFE